MRRAQQILLTGFTEAASRASWSTAAQPAAAAAGAGRRWVDAVLFLPAAISGYLAYWQLERAEWKADQVVCAQEALRHEPVDGFSLEQSGGSLPEFRRVHVSGHYDHEHSAFVGPRPRSLQGTLQAGYLLITPLHDDQSKRTVLVNRGWVPLSWRGGSGAPATATSTTPTAAGHDGSEGAVAAAPAAAAGTSEADWPQGRVSEVGVVQGSETPSFFMPANTPSIGQYFWVDLEALRQECGVDPSTPVIQVVDNDADSRSVSSSKPPWEQASQQQVVFPLPKPLDDVATFVIMPDHHRGYAGVWGTLAVACSYLAAVALRSKKPARGLGR